MKVYVLIMRDPGQGGDHIEGIFGNWRDAIAGGRQRTANWPKDPNLLSKEERWQGTDPAWLGAAWRHPKLPVFLRMETFNLIGELKDIPSGPGQEGQP